MRSLYTGLSRLFLFFFPIRSDELRKFIPFCLLIFITTFVHHLLRVVKDPLVLSEPGSGAEVLSFLKLYFALPASMLATMMYMSLRKRSSMSFTYYVIVGGYAAFIILYAFCIYPNVAWLHPSPLKIAFLQRSYPMFRWFFTIWGMWTYAFYYVTAEIWGTFVLSVMFWQLANDNIGVKQAETFYPLFVTISNVALLFLNPLVKYIADSKVNDMLEANIVVVCCSVMMLAVFYYLDTQGMSEGAPEAVSNKLKPKSKSVFSDGLALLWRSEYVGYLTMLVFCYACIVTLVEVTWKSQIRLLYPSRASYMAFYADYTFYTGIVTILLNYLSKTVIQRFGWTVGAIITPISCGIFGSLFYIFMLVQNAHFYGFDQGFMIHCAVWIGALSVMMSRGAKYAFFDPTKEMAFIPLEKNLSVNGKAIADGMGSKFGKSFGGCLVSTSMMLSGQDLEGLCVWLGMIVLCLSIFWLFAVLRLSVLYGRQVREATMYVDANGLEEWTSA